MSRHFSDRIVEKNLAFAEINIEVRKWDPDTSLLSKKCIYS